MAKKIPLTGTWKLAPEFLDVGPERFQEVLNREEGFPELAVWPRNFPVRHGYLKATVPCDVITPLVENGLLQEPLLRKNSDDCTWIKNMSWWFIREFEVDEEILKEEQVRLFIELLDYNADLILNNIPIGQHHNTFRPFEKDIKRYLKVGVNQLIIRLTSGVEDYYPVDRLSVYSDTSIKCFQRIHLRKPQFTYGWDWCKLVPTCGIGGSVYLEAFSGAKISHFRCDTTSINDDTATLDFYFEVEKLVMQSSADVTVEYEVLYGNRPAARGSLTETAAGGLNVFRQTVTIDNPKLWWPNGYGDPNQYTVRAVSRCNGHVNEMKDKKIGIRTIDIDRSKLEDGTRNFFVRVNGVRVFCKGGNWVPADSVYLRVTKEKYRTLVLEAKEANFNMLRIWGGGLYEADCFYESCSENGILLFHDFMFACAFYPDDNPLFMYEAQLEATYQSKRLAHYPCMALWAGNNEVHESYTDWFPKGVPPERLYGEYIYNYMLPETVRANCPSIFYMPSSPYFGVHSNENTEGDVHAWTFFGRDDNTKFKFSYELEAFDRFNARFCSEYGFFGANMESTVRRYFAGEEVSKENPIWKHHGEDDYKRNSIDGAIQHHLTEFSELDWKEYLLYSGIMQGCLYLEMAEGIRRKSCGSGDLIWMYNDAWPETGWTVIDYYLTRKISYYFLKRAFAHRKIILRAEDGTATATIINDKPESAEIQIEYGYSDFSGNKRRVGTQTITCEPHSWQQFIFKADGDLKRGFCYVSSDHPEFETACSVRAYYRELFLPEAEVRMDSAVEDGNDLLVTIHSDKFVPFAYLVCEDDRIHYSDNYVKLFPNEPKTIRVKGTKEIPRASAAAIAAQSHRMA